MLKPPPFPTKRPGFGAVWAMAAFSALLVGLLAASTSLRGLLHLPIPCAFKSLTGFPSAGCDSMRSVRAFVALDPWAAFIANPLFSLGLVLFVGGGQHSLVSLLAARAVKTPATPLSWFRWTLVATVGLTRAWMIFDRR
ncbi:MAG: hypothetical protein DIJKHBIC_02958 [Thermoanaerobaculia bacterium]|nr:hypothetical protein [Thermoanaerobaculia bacterium]